MNFIELDREEVARNSVEVDGYFDYKLGNPIEVSCLKKVNTNNLMSSNLSSNVIEDKYMIRYCPTNRVKFTRKLVESESIETFVSLHIDAETKMAYIGTVDEFDSGAGVLTFSGFTSLNGYVEEDKLIFGNSRVNSTLMQRVKVLSVGLRGDKLYGLYFIPSTSGMSIGVRGSKSIGVSTRTFKVKDCSESNSFTIKDWFEKTKIVER